MITDRSNNINFKMQFDNQSNIGGTTAQPQKSNNRTFADSVLLQGMVDRKNNFGKLT